MALCDPLTERFPSLGRIPRAELGIVVSPIEEWKLSGGESFWVKRDDLNAPDMGGNKVRALEFLLAGAVAEQRTVMTVGGIGSTHVLSTAIHARRLGLNCRAWRWPHEENPISRLVAAEIERSCGSASVVSDPAIAFALARWKCVTSRGHWVPFGGSSHLGMLGHIRAGLELAHQLKNSSVPIPVPAQVFVALGSGGTAAGLALGLAAAGLQTRVVAVRCGPSVGLDGRWLGWLGQKALRFLRANGVPRSRLPVWSPPEVVHDVYAGAYGRPFRLADDLASQVRESRGVDLDATYSAKACYAAQRSARLRATTGPVLFWNTFDARWIKARQPGNRR